MKKIILIQGSLNPNSRTAIVVNAAAKHFESLGLDVRVMDLRDMPLQFCDGRPLEGYNAEIQGAYQAIEAADYLVIGMPVYCYSVAGPLKNFIDITSEAMMNKRLGIISNAGGQLSYLASADLAKILAYESRVLAVQPTVYSWSKDFEDGKIVNPKIHEKIQAMAEALCA